MDFAILNTSGSELAVNAELLQRYLKEKNRSVAAMQYRTTCNNYKAGILTVSTEISLTVSQLDGSLIAASSKQITNFHFPERSTLTRGATKRATSILKNCIDLSQAHAYGHFMYKAASLELEYLPSAVAPIEQYEADIKDFLRMHSKL